MDGSNQRTPDLILADLDNRKMQNYYNFLKENVKDLPGYFLEKMTDPVLMVLAKVLLDDTVFEIVRGLEEIQAIMEQNLLNQRMRLVNEQKATWLDFVNRLESDSIDPVELEKGLEQKKNLEDRLDRKLEELDTRIILEMDDLISKQQEDLWKAGVPLMVRSSCQREIEIQMKVLELISKLMP